MDKKNKNPNVPNLRFPQFIEPWNNYIVSELLTTFPTNSLSWDQLVENQDSSLKNLHYGLIHNGFETTCITGENQLFPYIKHSFIPTKYALIQNGDLILADASEDRKDVGKPVEMLDIGNQKIVSGLHTIHARNKTDLIVNGFKGFYFQSSAMKQQIFKIANGSKIYGISSSAFNELKMFIPEKQEQKKIIDLMIKIEERIQTQSKIIDDLLTVKNGISNKLFKLQQIELSNHYLSEYLTEGDKTAVDTSCYKKITVKLNKQGLAFSELNREMADSRPFYVRHKGELIIGKQNYFNGSIAVVTEQFDNCICSNAIMSFKINNIDSDFLYYQISNNNYLNSQSYKANGTGQKELSEKEFLNC